MNTDEEGGNLNSDVLEMHRKKKSHPTQGFTRIVKGKLEIGNSEM